MSVKYLQTKATTLSYSIDDSATTMRLDNLLKLDGTSVAASDIGDLLYGTFDPGTSREEIFSIAAANVTVNADGTVDITTVVRGLKEVSPYGTGGFKTDHPAGGVVIFGDNPQLFQWLKDYIDAAVIAGGVPASDTVPGLVTEATQAQVDAGTAQETYLGTPYDLFARPDRMRAKKYNDYIADVGASDAYAITVVPAITAYTEGQEFTFKAATANTGAATLAVSGLSAITIKKDVSNDLSTGDILSGQIVKVVYDASGNFQMVSKTPSLAPVKHVYIANGTWTKPAGLKYIIVEVVGGGGGGGGGASTNRRGGGGGGGGYSLEIIAASLLGATENYIVGVGGTVFAGADGNVGGTTSFGTSPYLQATGGGGGKGSIGKGGDGGIGSNGDINIIGDGGGGSGSTSDSNGSAGKGGSSHWGGGGAGVNAAGASSVGGVYGGGGSGGASTTGDQPGGIGAVGVVIVTEYF